ncbi:hypothetical protein OG21DRAFT_120113 [Imleria badia]|nr:hypothetical protein OG21DRAFT_120113 [Imleria badia]
MFGKLLCFAALVSATLAQVNIALPFEGSNVTASAAFTIQLEIPKSTTNTEVAVAIGAIDHSAGPYPGDSLGYDVLYSGPFNPQSTNGADSESLYENITVTAPSYFQGKMLLSVAHFYIRKVGFTLSSHCVSWCRRQILTHCARTRDGTLQSCSSRTLP